MSGSYVQGAVTGWFALFLGGTLAIDQPISYYKFLVDALSLIVSFGFWIFYIFVTLYTGWVSLVLNLIYFLIIKKIIYYH